MVAVMEGMFRVTTMLMAGTEKQSYGQDSVDTDHESL